jgi:uncharacterized coiled-coil protein SlyX
MEQYETPLEAARRRVIEAELQVAAQVARISGLKRLHEDRTEEEAVLADLEDKLRILYEALELEQAVAARGRT